MSDIYLVCSLKVETLGRARLGDVGTYVQGGSHAAVVMSIARYKDLAKKKFNVSSRAGVATRTCIGPASGAPGISHA